MGLQANGRRRAVLFVDDDGWASFDQTVAALRRRGVRSIRVTHAPPASLWRLLREPYLRWFADRLLYNETIALSTKRGRRRLADLATAGEIADAIISEPTLLKIGLDTQEGIVLTANSLAFRGTAPDHMLDKYEVNETLAAAGVPVPLQISGGLCTPIEAVARLGLPAILKNPIGAAGQGVRLVQSEEDLDSALPDLAGTGQKPFYQQYIEGSVVMYAAVIGPDGAPVIEHGLRVEESQSRLGPSAAVSLYDRTELIDLGRRATDLFKPQGFVAFGFIEAQDGSLFHIDANMRVWGNIASPLKLGINYLDAYLSMLREEPWTAPTSPDERSGALVVYPYALFESVRSGSVRDVAVNATEFLKVCRSALGFRYCLQTLGQAVLLTAAGRSHTRRQR